MYQVPWKSQGSQRSKSSKSPKCHRWIQCLRITKAPTDSQRPRNPKVAKRTRVPESLMTKKSQGAPNWPKNINKVRTSR